MDSSLRFQGRSIRDQQKKVEQNPFLLRNFNTFYLVESPNGKVLFATISGASLTTVHQKLHIFTNARNASWTYDQFGIFGKKIWKDGDQKISFILSGCSKV